MDLRCLREDELSSVAAAFGSISLGEEASDIWGKRLELEPFSQSSFPNSIRITNKLEMCRGKFKNM